VEGVETAPLLLQGGRMRCALHILPL
jgi:hypothetical protein